MYKFKNLFNHGLKSVSLILLSITDTSYHFFKLTVQILNKKSAKKILYYESSQTYKIRLL